MNRISTTQLRHRKKIPTKSTDTLVGPSAFARCLPPTLVVLMSLAVFLPILRNEFVDWDDYQMLVNNSYYRGLTWPQLRWMLTTFHMGHYQPLSWLTFGLDYVIWGTDPFGYHLTNLVLHAANAALFFFLARLLLAAAFQRSNDAGSWALNLAAALAALLFSVHPLRVESVAWATERRDVLSGLFFLFTIYFYLRSQLTLKNPERRKLFALSLGAYALSLSAKASGISVPLVLLLLDIYPLRKLPMDRGTLFKPVGRLAFEKLPFAILAFLFAVIALFAQQSAGALRPAGQYFLSYRVGQALYGSIFYLWKSLIPVALSPLYELPYDFAAWTPTFVMCGVLAGIISVATFLWRNSWPAGLACWVYYVFMIAPVLGVAQSGPQLVADRYSYLSCLGWAVLLGGIFFFLCTRRPAGGWRVMTATFMTPLIVIAFLVLSTWNQTRVWRDSRTLWAHAIAVAPSSSIARYNFGRILENENALDAARDSYMEALKINPTHADAHYNLARLLAKQGRHDDAIGHYRQALTVRPNDADTHNNLGLLLALKGHAQSALQEFERAAQCDPNYAKAFFNMARLFARQGEQDKAVRNYRQALKLNPSEVEILLGLGDALGRQGETEEAIEHLQKAVLLKPESADAHVALARLLAGQGRKIEAEKHYGEALRLLNSRKKDR